MNFFYNRKGKIVRIKTGADEELYKRNWHRGVDRNHDGERGEICFEFAPGSPDHHFSVMFLDNKTVGFPPEFVEFV